MRKSTPKQNDVGSSSTVNLPHFFKIVTHSNVVHNKLMIPRKFIKENGNKFRDSVLLRVSSGEVWTVDLKRKNGQVLLCNGWKKFASYFSIRPGHLLVFKYKGKSNFNVIIFDKSASEIDYPFDAVRENHKNTTSKGYAKKEIADDDCVQVVEDIQMKDNPQPTRGIKKEHFKGTSTVTSESGALRRAKAFKSGKPYFILTMGKSYVSARATLSAPVAFAEQHFRKGRTKIMLQISCGRTWSSMCVFTNQPPSCRLYWPSFAKDNDLKVGDVCVFEMINHVKPCLHVHIFRAS